MIDETFADFVLRDWERAASAVRSTSFNQKVWRDTERKTAGIEIDSGKFLVMVQIWDHAECLDVTTMEKTSEISKMLSAGPCDGREDARRRLSQLIELLASQ